jgi:hypothetical protein
MPYNPEEWKSAGAGETEGIKVWRIENSTLTVWPKDLHGSFHDGDSYIVLQSKKDADGDLQHNIHFWHGKGTSWDEAALAQQKTEELDQFLGSVTVQFRQYQGNETGEFQKLWPHGVRIISGGVDTSFNPAHPEKFQPRLLHVKGTRTYIRVTEVPLAIDSLNHGDAYILDAGLNVFQWNGIEASGVEKQRAGEVAHEIKRERNARPVVHVIDDQDDAPEFWKFFGGRKEIKSALEGGSDELNGVGFVKKLVGIAISEVGVDFVDVASEAFSRKKLLPDRLFIVDTENSIFLWIGKDCENRSKKLGFTVMSKYVEAKHRPKTTPIVRIMDPLTNAAFDATLAK